MTHREQCLRELEGIRAQLKFVEKGLQNDEVVLWSALEYASEGMAKLLYSAGRLNEAKIRRERSGDAK